MARIPEPEVQRLKDEVAVQRLIESAGIELKRVGKDLAGRCPFHEDSEPSLIVTPAKNLWHCFGCQCGGGPIDWAMKLKGVSFRHAVELLKDDSVLAAGSLGAGGEPVKRSTVRTLSAPVSLDADDHALLAQVVD
jgi:DNA primase